jgi:hypothetical protein
MEQPDQNPSLPKHVIQVPVVTTIYRTQSPFELHPPKAVRVWRKEEEKRRFFFMTVGLIGLGLLFRHRAPKSSC